jgi:hypothetical protein
MIIRRKALSYQEQLVCFYVINIVKCVTDFVPFFALNTRNSEAIFVPTSRCAWSMAHIFYFAFICYISLLVTVFYNHFLFYFFLINIYVCIYVYHPTYNVQNC